MHPPFFKGERLDDRESNSLSMEGLSPVSLQGLAALSSFLITVLMKILGGSLDA